MRRKKRHQDHENLERWLVSYADFITLLFAFFVVMYSISSLNEGKYRVLSDTLVAAFDTVPKTMQPVQVGVEGLTGEPTIIQPEKVRPAVTEEPVLEAPPETDPMVDIASDFERLMLPYIKQDVIRVKRDNFWVEVELNTNFLFASGSAELEDEARPLLGRLAEVLKKYPNLVQVEGFTDNVPIDTDAYPSNWELSAARAASVVHLFMNVGVEPERMAAVGFGEYHPIAENTTPEGRNRNRRVAVVVLADADARRQVRQLLDIGRGK